MILEVTVPFLVVATICYIYARKQLNKLYQQLDTTKKEAKDFTVEIINELKQDVSEAIPQIAQNMMASFKGQFMAEKSADVRGEKAIMGSLAQDMLNQSNPLVGAVLDQFPSVKAQIKRNPDLIQFLLPLIQQFMGKLPQLQGQGEGQGQGLSSSSGYGDFGG